MIWVSYHQLITIVWWSSGPFLQTDLVELSQVCRSFCSRMPWQISPQIQFRSRQPQNNDFVVLKTIRNHFGCILRVLIHLDNSFILTSRLMSLDVASILPLNVLPLWCHLFYEVHQLFSSLGMVFIGYKLPVFFSTKCFDSCWVAFQPNHTTWASIFTRPFIFVLLSFDF